MLFYTWKRYFGVFIKTLLLLFIALLVKPASSENKVKVRVFYEALCPGSREFVSEELGPTTDKLSDFLNVHLVPYGHANTTEESGKYYFTCQHGEEECLGNKIHACSIEAIENMTKSVQFIACMMSGERDPSSALHRCGKEMNISTDPIEKCANSDQGSLLLKKYGDETNLVNPEFVPLIEVNGSTKNQENLNEHLLTEICKHIDEPLPPACKQR